MLKIGWYVDIGSFIHSYMSLIVERGQVKVKGRIQTQSIPSN